jgi:hypothetical protein
VSGDPLAPNFLEGAQIALSEWQVEAWQCIGGVGVSAYVRKDATVRSVAA